MKKLLTILFLLVTIVANAQFFKYSTFYVSGNINSPLAEQPHYMMDRATGEFTDVTIVNPYNYELNLGLRKIARFDYENKAKNFYDGSENSISNTASIGAVSGYEYLLSCAFVRDRGEEFMKYHFGKAIDEYNQRELKAMGLQQELSTVLGIAYYTYIPKFWIHGWVDVLPYHHGLSEYSYVDMDIEDKEVLDFDTGLIFGTKITKRLGLFIEGRYQRYWNIDNYELKTGINYSIF